MTTTEQFDAALAHHKAGRLDQAASLYDMVLAEAPEHADALHLSALIVLQRGDGDGAIGRLARAAAAAPDRARIQNDLGAALRIAGRLAEAEAALARATALEPGHADAWSNLGMVRRAMGNFAAARAALEQAIALKPNFAPSFNALGAVTKALGDRAGARAAFERAVALKPDYLEALTGLGLLLNEDGDPVAALVPLQRAVDLAPERAETQLNLGLAQYAAGKTILALRSLGQAVSLNPKLAPAWNALGIAQAALHDIESSCDALARAAALEPRSAEILSNYGLSLHKAGRDDEARDALARALAIDPRHANAIFNRGVLRQHCGDFAGALEDWKATLDAEPGHRLARSNLIFSLHYEPAMDGPGLLVEARAYDRLHGRPAGQHTTWANPRDPERRLRVGYVSPDFREHSVAHYVEPLFGAHDRNAVEIFAYAELRRSDPVTERLKTLVDHWRSVSGMRDEDAARQMRADGIDILIDLAGHSADNRLDVFALRPAPVQLAWLGFPGTTGLSAIGFRLTDAVADPPGADAHASECLIRLPRGFHCWRPPAGAPEIAPRAMDRPPTFGSFNNIQKLNKDTVSVWSQILARVPEARLSLKSSWLSRPAIAQTLRQAFAAHGVAPERILLSGWLAGAAAHLGAYRDVDVALDPFPYNGTTTTFEALWMGVPVITLLGTRHAGRVGASLLTQLGAEEFIAVSAEDYVHRAVSLAADDARLAAYRGTLRAKLAASPATDATGFARMLEGVYRRLWRDWCGRAP